MSENHDDRSKPTGTSPDNNIHDTSTCIQSVRNDHDISNHSSRAADTDTNSNNDTGTGTGTATGDLSGEAAGVVRGVSRSIVRAPFVGRLPKAAPRPSPSAARGLLRRRVPVRRVARVSDKVSTGLDWFTSALEANEGTDDKVTTTTTTTTKRQWCLRARSFAWNLFRNTLLGMAVFESYGYVIESLAPPPKEIGMETMTVMTGEHPSSYGVTSDLTYHHGNDGDYGNGDKDDNNDDDDENEEESSLFGNPDAYSRASIPVHFISGSLAGTIHGCVSSVMEGHAMPGSMARYTTLNTFHHSMAHSMLFGSYETIKRGILNYSEDEGRPGNRTYHLVTFALAGGLAGQLQHLVSHYVEASLGLSNHTLQLEWRSSFRTPVAIRPLLWAFPPSAIGFIAFEYGKQFMT